MLIFHGLECDLNTGIAQNLLCSVFLQCIKVGLSVVFERLEILPAEYSSSMRVL